MVSAAPESLKKPKGNKRDRTRAALLEAARALVREKGFARASAPDHRREIRLRCGVARDACGRPRFANAEGAPGPRDPCAHGRSRIPTAAHTGTVSRRGDLRSLRGVGCRAAHSVGRNSHGRALTIERLIPFEQVVESR